MKTALTFITVLCLPMLATLQPTISEPSAEDKGKQIGTIIKSAVTEALPVVGDIMNLIWPEGSTRINKEELENKLKEEKKAINEQISANIQEKLKPLRIITAELNVLQIFILPGSNISTESTKIISYANQSSIDWDEIGVSWTKIGRELTQMQNANTKSIRSTYIRLELDRLISANRNVVVDIDDAVKRKLKDKLTASVVKLENIVNLIPQVLSMQLYDYSSDFETLVKWADGEMSGSSNHNSESQKEMMTLLSAKINALNNK